MKNQTNKDYDEMTCRFDETFSRVNVLFIQAISANVCNTC